MGLLFSAALVHFDILALRENCIVRLAQLCAYDNPPSPRQLHNHRPDLSSANSAKGSFYADLVRPGKKAAHAILAENHDHIRGSGRAR